jgi:uncharacterized membrane protein
MLPSTPDLPVVPRRLWLLWAAVLCLLCIGVAIAGAERSLGINEVWAILHAREPIGEHLRVIQSDLVHPPLMYLVHRAWIRLFGDSDGTIKILPVVMAVPTIVLFTWFASRVSRSWVLASFLFAATFMRIGGPATQARMYGLTLLLVVAAMVLWEAWRQRPRPGVLAAWAATMLLLLYTHYLGAFTLAAFLLVEWMYGSHRRTVTALCVAIGIAFLPWILFVWPTDQAVGADRPMRFEGLYRQPFEIPLQFFGSVQPGPELGGPADWFQMMAVHAGVSAVLAMINLAVLVVAWPRLRRIWPPWKATDETTRRFWTLATLAAVPILMVLVLVNAALLITSRPMNPRYAIGALPAYVLVLVLLGEWGGRNGKRLLYAVVLPWVLVSTTVSLLESRIPSRHRQGTLAVAERMSDGDLVLCENVIGGETYWEWTRRLHRSGRFVVLPFERNDWWFDVLPQASLDSTDFSQVNRVWFLYFEGRTLRDVAPQLAQRGFTRDESFSPPVPGLEAFVRTQRR